MVFILGTMVQPINAHLMTQVPMMLTKGQGQWSRSKFPQHGLNNKRLATSWMLFYPQTSSYILSLLFFHTLTLLLQVITHLFSLSELEKFIKDTDAGMSVTVVKGDTETLIKVMTHLNNVRERMATTDQMFDPLKQAIQLLHTYGQESSDAIHCYNNQVISSDGGSCRNQVNGDYFLKIIHI